MTVSDVAPAAIRVEGLGKRYRLQQRSLGLLRELLAPSRAPAAPSDVWAVRELTFSVPRGAVYGLLGPNGAGKSTTLKLLAGRLRPTTGRVEVEGSVSAILELGTGLNPNLTGRQNARLNALFMGLDPWRVEEQLERILAFAELGDYVDQPLHTYSTGMKARLAFAVLTIVEPEVLILDEALATGDAAFADKCKRFIRELCRSGCTTIVVSHDLGFLGDLCEHLLWIDHGRLRGEGPPRELIPEYLASIGVGEAGYRPAHALLRLAPAEPGPPLEYLVQAAEWVDASGEPLAATHLVGDLLERQARDRAALVGLSERAARAGWGPTREVPPHHAPFRVLRLEPGEVVHLALAIPAPPAAPPAALRFLGLQQLERELEVSLLVDGAARPLGRIGREGSGYSSLLPLPPELFAVPARGAS